MCVRIFSLGSTASIEIVAKLSFGNLSTPFTKVESNETRSKTVNARTKTHQVLEHRLLVGFINGFINLLSTQAYLARCAVLVKAVLGSCVWLVGKVRAKTRFNSALVLPACG